MINQYRSTSLPRQDENKAASISEVYDQIMRNFDKQALRIRFKFSNPSFDDALLVRPRKTLPKIQIQTERKARMKFYSNKLVVNQAVYINQRRQCSPRQAHEQQFNKLSIPHPKEISILSDRNKRIMELYRRAEKDAELSPVRIKFTERIQSLNKVKQSDKQKQKQQAIAHPMKKMDQLRSSQKRMIDILRQASERRKKQQGPSMRPQRSKSNIIINSYSTEPENPQKHTLECKKIQQKNQEPKERVQTMKKIKYEPKKDPIVLKKKFNWRNQLLSLNKIDRQEFHRLIRCYLSIGEPVPIQSGFYKAYVGYGNNCALIKKLLKDRGYWTIVQSLDEQPNFVWTQIKSTKFSSILSEFKDKQFQPVIRQHFQQNSQLTNFIKLKRNDYISGCEKLFQNKHFLMMMNQIKQRFQNGNNVIYFNRLRQVYYDYLQQGKLNNTPKDLKSSEIKLHNHMDNSGAIGDKKQLLYMMSKYCQIFGEQINNLIPQTVHLENSEDFQNIFEKIPEGPWVLKPGQATNRGQGITIHTNRQSLINQISKKKKHKGGLKFTNIIQKYVQPLLYNGRKFDIRIWVLWNGRRLWWYREGYLRTSSKQFTLKSLNKFIHLTNDAIQSQSDDFGKFEPANKLSFNEFEKYLESQYNYQGFYTQMLAQMKKLAIKAFRMGNLVFDDKNRQYTFQLFGLDFLIDSKFKPWLIQCNTNPCLQINCSLLARLVPNMLQNVMNLTIDSYFPVPTKRKLKDPQVWNHETFKFQLLYNGNIDIQMQQKLLTNNVKIAYQQPEPQLAQLQKQVNPSAQDSETK